MTIARLSISRLRKTNHKTYERMRTFSRLNTQKVRFESNNFLLIHFVELWGGRRNLNGRPLTTHSTTKVSLNFNMRQLKISLVRLKPLKGQKIAPSANIFLEYIHFFAVKCRFFRSYANCDIFGLLLKSFYIIKLYFMNL